MADLRLDITVPLRHFALDVALEVGEGETVALVGPSGAGKTTVLRAIAGAVRPGSGRITLGDDTLFDAARRIDRPPESRRVGYVFQEYALFPHMTVRQNVAFAGQRAGRRAARSGSASPTWPARGRGACRAASASGWASPGPWRATRPCCSSTSRSPRSTPTRARAVRAELFDLLRELRLPPCL